MWFIIKSSYDFQENQIISVKSDMNCLILPENKNWENRIISKVWFLIFMREDYRICTIEIIQNFKGKKGQCSNLSEGLSR